MFFLVAVFFSVLLLAMRRGDALGAFMSKASPVMLWLAMLPIGAALVFGPVFWGRYVPKRLSVILAILAWAVLLCMVVWFEWLGK